MKIRILQVLLLMAVIQRFRTEIFTAMADMEHVFEVQNHIASLIKQYAALEQRRITKLTELAKQYEIKKSNDLKKSIYNPINAYMLIKQWVNDWDQVETLMKQNLAEDFLFNFTSTRQIRFPTAEDLNGAAAALMRLQDTYHLNTRDIADGKIKGSVTAPTMDGFSCYELGRTAYEQHDYYHTVMWMQEALNRIEQENPPSIEAAEVIEYLAFSLLQQGNLERSLSLTKQLTKLDPIHPRAERNVKIIEDQLKSAGINPTDLFNLPPISNNRTADYADEADRDNYERLCRGEAVMNPKEQAKYYCYLKRDHSFLFLAPIKVEIVKHNPLAVLFRECMSDYEIEVIKKLATPMLARSQVGLYSEPHGETTLRISKNTWLKQDDHPVVGRVNARIEMMTNLEMSTAEYLQVVNYGLGGHYDIHFDHAKKSATDPFGFGIGNRIATTLFYMNDVEAGGATVFPLLDLAVFPQKGSALFWYNLNRDGEGDYRTLHAACPVLTGQKWVSNKWIHEIGNEWKRPCDKKPGQTNEEFV